ncbi:hypothetical protein RQP46_005350 [Phenoliferia psychrophenolica]
MASTTASFGNLLNPWQGTSTSHRSANPLQLLLPRASITSLPTELITRILEFARIPAFYSAGHPTLHAASLVCRQWHLPAQRLLWSQVSFRGEWMEERLRQFIESDATLERRYEVKEFVLGPDPTRTGDRYRLRQAVWTALGACGKSVISLGTFNAFDGGVPDWGILSSRHLINLKVLYLARPEQFTSCTRPILLPFQLRDLTLTLGWGRVSPHFLISLFGSSRGHLSHLTLTYASRALSYDNLLDELAFQLSKCLPRVASTLQHLEIAHLPWTNLLTVVHSFQALNFLAVTFTIEAAFIWIHQILSWMPNKVVTFDITLTLSDGTAFASSRPLPLGNLVPLHVLPRNSSLKVIPFTNIDLGQVDHVTALAFFAGCKARGISVGFAAEGA